MIRLLLAEDQSLVRGALRALLELEPDFEVVGEAADGQSAVELAARLTPDVCLFDIEMPRRDGIAAALEVRENSPSSRVVILTTFARSGYLARALSAGVRGYLLKTMPPAQLADAVRRISAGARVIDPELAAEALSEPNPLTTREREVLRLAEQGLTAARIGQQLGLSDGTVRNYLSEAIAKVEASGRIDAARTARSRGWL